jgi:hypothetical protein
MPVATDGAQCQRMLDILGQFRGGETSRMVKRSKLTINFKGILGNFADKQLIPSASFVRCPEPARPNRLQLISKAISRRQGGE